MKYFLTPVLLLTELLKFLNFQLNLKRRPLVSQILKVGQHGIVVGSPHISGAGRTQFCYHLLKALNNLDQVLVLSYDVHRDLAKPSDDALFLMELGVKVVITSNRSLSIRENPEYKYYLFDGGWEDPALDDSIHIGLFRSHYQANWRNLWPLGDLRSLPKNHKTRKNNQIDLHWSKNINWSEDTPVNNQAKKWDFQASSSLLLSGGDQEGLKYCLEQRGFIFDEVFSLRDHSRQLESKLLFLLDTKPYAQVLITNKERVKCTKMTLESSRIFILDDQILGFNFQDFWKDLL